MIFHSFLYVYQRVPTGWNSSLDLSDASGKETFTDENQVDRASIQHLCGCLWDWTNSELIYTYIYIYIYICIYIYILYIYIESVWLARTCQCRLRWPSWCPGWKQFLSSLLELLEIGNAPDLGLTMPVKQPSSYRTIKPWFGVDFGTNLTRRSNMIQPSMIIRKIWIWNRVPIIFPYLGYVHIKKPWRSQKFAPSQPKGPRSLSDIGHGSTWSQHLEIGDPHFFGARTATKWGSLDS